MKGSTRNHPGDERENQEPSGRSRGEPGTILEIKGRTRNHPGDEREYQEPSW
jgi:hypothetical protein